VKSSRLYLVRMFCLQIIKIRRTYRMSMHSEQDLKASEGYQGTISSGINLNPKQPVRENEVGDTGMMSNDIQSSTMCENTTSMCIESIYEDVSKYRLNSNDEFKIVTNKRFKKSNKGIVNNSQLTNTF
jgi:hypothetical protein